jgi:hypothetical protein
MVVTCDHFTLFPIRRDCGVLGDSVVVRGGTERSLDDRFLGTYTAVSEGRREAATETAGDAAPAE